MAQYGHALQWASEDMKGDKGVVLAAMEKTNAALRWASGTAMKQSEFMLAVYQQIGSSIKPYNTSGVP